MGLVSSVLLIFLFCAFLIVGTTKHIIFEKGVALKRGLSHKEFDR